MKIQCSCGAKYSFDVTPEMVARPVQFTCSACGLDSTAVVNQLIQQQFGGAAIPAPAAAPPLPSAVVTPLQPAAPVPPAQPKPAQPKPVLHVAHHAAPAPAAADAPQPCLKHFGQFATNRCVVCQKAICPQCMALFGWVCSPLCRNKAESSGIEVPEYEGQKSVTERKQWRKIARIAGIAAGGVLLVLGVWFWYEWFGSVPSARYAVRFSYRAMAGELRLAAQGQTVMLHGGRLARHDPKEKREVWSLDLLDRKSVAEQAAIALKQLEAEREEAAKRSSRGIRLPSLVEITKDIERASEMAFSLHVAGNNIWVESPGKLTRHDWETGKAKAEIPFMAGFSGATRHGGELLSIEREEGGSKITRFDLASGDVKTETIARPEPSMVVARSNAAPALTARGRPGAAPTRGGASNLLARAARPAPGAKPLDPAAVARDAQRMPLPNRLALPATVSAAANQQRLQAAMDEDEERPADAGMAPVPDLDDSRLMPSGNGFVELSSRLIQSRTVLRKVMKDAPKQSALDGPVNQAATAAIANELLNEMQRDRFGDSVEEDQSRYEATLRREGVPDWKGEVVGRPFLAPLQTVDVVLAGKSATVVDKNNKKLWEAKLTFEVAGGGWSVFEEGQPRGAGPCVERGDTLYLFDQGVLSCFELASGNARWRLPSVGTVGLFFDDGGMLYVNTSTASPDSVKFSRQIDISQKTHEMVLKIDPKTGKTLWGSLNNGFVNYVSGKFVYTYESQMGDDEEDSGGLGGIGIVLGVTEQPHVRIKRLNPRNGRVMWEHFQQRGALDAQFNRNEIQLLFRRELQVLRFLTL